MLMLSLVLSATACASRHVSVQTAAVTRGSLVQSVTASGTVNPRDTIIVGSQVSGTIQEIRVDFNSIVRRGQVLTILDRTPFEAALAQSRASAAQAQAQEQAAAATLAASRESAQASALGHNSAEAGSVSAASNAAAARARLRSVDAMVAKQASALSLAQLTLRRDRQLLAQGYVAQSVVDADIANLDADRAALDDAEATARQARYDLEAAGAQTTSAMAQAGQQAHIASSSLAQSRSAASSYAAAHANADAVRAAVRQAELNLSHAVITSPVDGTVVARNISVGQTVAAAFQSPTLFTIATDLRKMEVDVAVGEPDVGSVKEGQSVELTVLAYPHRTFTGRVSQVRQNPTVTQNVTTYTAVIYVDNADGSLRPGMTANAKIRIARFDHALTLPLSALRWAPSGDVAKAYHVAKPSQPAGGQPSGSAWGRTGATTLTASPGSLASAWVLRGRNIEDVDVEVLGVDGTVAAIIPRGESLSEGALVVIADNSGGPGS